MKNVFFKLGIVLVSALFESAVGVPVVVLSLFLLWKREESFQFVVWLVGVALILSVLWNLPWGLATGVLFVMRILYDFITTYVLNRLLRVFLVVIPFSLLFAVYLGMMFSWREVIYTVISVLIIVLFQRHLISSYENQYL